MTAKEKFNKFIEDEAIKTDSVALEDLIKQHKPNLQKGTLENSQLFAP